MSDHERSRPSQVSFRSRMWILLSVSITIYIMLWLPEMVRDWTLNGRVNELKRQIDDAAQGDDPLGAISARLLEAGFTERGGGTIPQRIGTQQNQERFLADLHLSDGTPFWRPLSVVVIVDMTDYEGVESALRVEILYPSPVATQAGRSSRWDRILPGYSILLPSAVAMIVLIRVYQREMRVGRGECRECGYPTGVSRVCTECGAPIPNRSARTSRV